MYALSQRVYGIELICTFVAIEGARSAGDPNENMRIHKIAPMVPGAVMPTLMDCWNKMSVAGRGLGT